MFYLDTEKKAFDRIFDEELEPKESVKKRNKIRRKLRSSFESISVSIFPQPGENLRDLDPSTTSEEFQARVDGLKKKILGQMSQPRKFGKTVVNSQSVDSLARKFVKNLENGCVVHVKSAVSRYQREEIEKAKRLCEEHLREAYKKINLPVIYGLEKQLTQAKDAPFETFRKSTANIDLEDAYKDEVLQNLIQYAEHEIDVKKKDNRLVIAGMLKNNSIILIIV